MEWKTSGIYKITFCDGEYFYIGSTICLKRRERDHMYGLTNNNHCNIIMMNLYNKHPDTFMFEVVEYCERSELIKREQYYIDDLNPNINVCKVAGNCLGVKHTEATREKLRNKIITKETRAKLSKALNGKPSFMKGKHHTEESRRKISESNTGQKRSLESRQRMSEAQKGIPVSEETRRKISKTLTGKYVGWNHTEEAKDLMRKANTRRILQLNKWGKIINEFESSKDACSVLGLGSRSKVSECLNKKKKYYKGFMWKYKYPDNPRFKE